MDSEVSTELNYQKKSISHPTYQFSQIYQQTGGQAFAVAANATAESVFELPPKVYNLSKTVLSYTSTPTAASAGGRTNIAHINGITMIRQIQLYSRTGTYLADINDLHIYSNMTSRHENDLEDVLTWDRVSAGVVGGGFFQGLRPSSDLNTVVATLPQTGAAGVFVYPQVTLAAVGGAQQALRVADATGAAAANNANANVFFTTRNFSNTRPDNTISYSDDEPSYVLAGSDAAVAPVINYQIPLGNIQNSIFSINKDVYFDDTLYLRIVWNPSTTTIYNIPSPGAFLNYDPNTGAGPDAIGLNITRMSLYAAIEVNQVIVQEIKNKTTSGMTLSVPFVFYNKIGTGASTSQSISVRYNRAHGKKLKAIYVAPYNQAQANSTLYEHSCLAGTRLLTYYAMLNNVRLEQFNFDIATGNDYMAKKEHLKRSCIRSSNDFYYNFVHREIFTSDPDCCKDSNVDDGLVLETEVKYDFVTTSANVALSYFVYAVTTKELTVTPAGITFV